MIIAIRKPTNLKKSRNNSSDTTLSLFKQSSNGLILELKRKCLNFSKRKISWTSNSVIMPKNAKISVMNFPCNLWVFIKYTHKIFWKWRNHTKNTFNSKSIRTAFWRKFKTLRSKLLLNYSKIFLYRCKIVREIRGNRLPGSHKSKENK